MFTKSMPISGFYMLDSNGDPVACEDREKFSIWCSTANRTVARTEIAQVIVVTSFLMIDHNYSEQGDPILFETMIFINNHGQLGDSIGYQERYRTRAEAFEGHKRAIDWMRSQP